MLHHGSISFDLKFWRLLLFFLIDHFWAYQLLFRNQLIPFCFWEIIW